MIALPPGYDAWRTAGPDEDRVEIGTEEGQPCNRLPEPDEDHPRPRPVRCQGTMEVPKVEGCTCFINSPCSACVDNPITCDACGEEA